MLQKAYISYRRADSEAYAGRLSDYLSAALGGDCVLRGDQLAKADAQQVWQAISECAVCLVLIGRGWTSAIKKARHDDLTLVEIRAALKEKVPIIPVLVDDAKMPTTADVPSFIRPIALRQAARINHDSFRADVQSLARVVERHLMDVRPSRNQVASQKATFQIGIPERPADVAWAAIQGSATADDLRDFIARFPDAPNLSLARKRMETLLWSEINTAPTAVSVMGYLADYPNGVHGEDARMWLTSRLDALREEISALDARRSDVDREIELIVGPPSTYRNDIFVSYSKDERELAEAIAAVLEKSGYQVWWDTNLVSGDEFSDVIRQELVGSKVVVVLWTTTSVKSKWVKAEAVMADFDDKLVPVRTRDLDPRDIPMPFVGQHCEFVDDHEALIKAIQKKGAHPSSQLILRKKQSSLPNVQLSWWKRVFSP